MNRPCEAEPSRQRPCRRNRAVALRPPSPRHRPEPTPVLVPVPLRQRLPVHVPECLPQHLLAGLDRYPDHPAVAGCSLSRHVQGRHDAPLVAQSLRPDGRRV